MNKLENNVAKKGKRHKLTGKTKKKWTDKKAKLVSFCTTHTFKLLM